MERWAGSKSVYSTSAWGLETLHTVVLINIVLWPNDVLGPVGTLVRTDVNLHADSCSQSGGSYFICCTLRVHNLWNAGIDLIVEVDCSRLLD